MTDIERYKLDCHSCRRTVELPAGDPRKPERLTCPRCGAALLITWRPNHE